MAKGRPTSPQATLADELHAAVAKLKGPPRCAGCLPECRDAVRELIDEALAKKIRISLGVIYLCCTQRGVYTQVLSAFRKHVVDHESERWRALKAAGLVTQN